MREPMRRLLCSWSWVLALLLLQAPVVRAGAEPVRVLIFSGQNNHDWRSTTPFLKQLLSATGRFDVRVVEEPRGISQATLASYDVLVLDYMGPRWGEDTERAVVEFVRSGKGLVAVHGASYAFTGMEILGDGHARTGRTEPPWPEYLEMVGGYWAKEEPASGHGRLHSFKVRFSDSSHPIAQGIGDSFIATDELYHHLRLRPEARVLARAFSDPKTRGTGKEEPILWTVDYGKGRIFYTALGHDVAAMQETGFVTTFARGTEWAATGKVTLPPRITWDQKPSEAVRTLVVTGGHDYNPSFYSLFQDVPGLAWSHAASNLEAFAKDRRSSYDVLVLYDFSGEIGDREKENLQAFVESGKGIVVLHHAIADYPSWPWWYQEVVGGRYLLQAENELPASTFKHDEEIFAEVTEPHPVTSGLGALHLWDETYRQMWISPDVNVLLKTDNPTSDGPLAWVSPYGKSRVVYIQLGHGPEAHRNAGYRQLVKNAIFWTAGKAGDR